MGFLGGLGLLFIGLRLGGIIDWSWWWVTSPLWGGLALFVVALAVGSTIVYAAHRRKKRTSL